MQQQPHFLFSLRTDREGESEFNLKNSKKMCSNMVFLKRYFFETNYLKSLDIYALIFKCKYLEPKPMSIILFQVYWRLREDP